MVRVNFAAPIRRDLAERVGQRCSYPGCLNPTIGPKSGGGVARAGMACHIYPASGKGPRAALPLPRGMKRGDFENGVWMCGHHGTIVDRDDGRFTPEILTAYRQRAEDRHAESFYGDAHRRRRSLFDKTEDLSFHRGASEWEDRLPSEWRSVVAETLRDGGIAAEWGSAAQHAVWMLFAELTRNTAEHGTGTGITVRTAGNVAELVIHGDAFDLEDLRQHPSPRGAGSTLSDLEQDFRDELLVNHAATRDGVSIQVISVALASPSDPCSAEIRRREPMATQIDKIGGCATMHLYTPEHLMRSDGPVMVDAVKEALSRGGFVAVHYRPMQDWMVRSPIERACADEISRIRFFEIPDRPSVEF